MQTRVRCNSDPVQPRHLPAHPSDQSLFICVEVEAREDRRTEWESGYAEELLTLMGKESVYRRERKYQVGSRQFFDSSRAVHLTRFSSNESVCNSYRPFAGPEHCTAEEWAQVERVMTKFQEQAKVSHFLVNGRAAQETVALLNKVATKWGWVRPSILRVPQQPWLTRLLYTGEAVACLFLTANLATQLPPPTTVQYAVRGRHGDGVVQLTEPFE